MAENKKDFTLYIGDLDPNVTEHDLNTLFRGLSLNVKNIRLGVVHGSPAEALKYAYVTFENREEAEKARRDANDSVLYERHIRVCFMNRNRTTAANLFIKGLGDVTARDLENSFSAFGAITSCKVLFDEKGVSRGYGFLQYEKQEEAEAAIKSRNGTVLGGHTITVDHFIPKDQREMPHPNNIYVRGFGPELSNEALQQRFSEFGEISSSIVLPNSSLGGEVRYFGFVCFKTSESANQAIQALHNVEEGSIQWYVAPHLSKRDRSFKLQNEFKQKQEYWKQRNLYVSKLQAAIDEEKLYKLFRDFGEISSVKVLKSENIKYDAEGNKYLEQMSRGSGFVCFQRPEDAERAFSQMDRKKVEDREIRVFRWKPKSEMQKIITSKRHRLQAYQMYMMPPQTKGAGRGGFRGPMPMQFPMMQPEMMMGMHGRPQPYNSQPSLHHPYQGHSQHPQQHPQHTQHPQHIQHPHHTHHPRQARPQPREQPVAPQPEPVVQQSPINLAEYQSATAENKKRLLGENLYPRILKLTNQHVAGKVTGMLLEMKNDELLDMLTQGPKLKEKVDEAIEVLREAWKNRPDQLALLGR